MLDLCFLKSLKHNVIALSNIHSNIWRPSRVTSLGLNYFVTLLMNSLHVLVFI